MNKKNELLCPCGSTKMYSECCGKYHQGTNPENALALMKSRYSAYSLNLADYIMHTTHPKNPRFKADKTTWKKQILEFSQNTVYEKLDILDFTDGSIEAFVTFVAHLKHKNKDATFTERSRFEKINGQWLYLDGVIS